MLPSLILYFFTLLAVLLSLLIIYSKWSLSYWKRKGVPYLEPSIPFGNFRNPVRYPVSLGFSYREFYEHFKRMGKQFGGIYSYITPILVPIDPDVIKTILVKEFSSFHDRGFYYNEKDQPVSASIFTVDGERWRGLRTKFTSTFTSAKMKSMFNLMVACGDVLEEHVKELVESKKPMNVSNYVRRLATDVIGSCAFGIECNSFEDESFFNTLEKTFLEMSSFFKQTFCNSLPNVARLLKIPLVPHKEANFIIHFINEALNFRTEKNFTRNDFLQILLEMKNNDILNMGDIHAQCILFFVAGYQTSTSTITFSLFELARNKDVQERLRKEMIDIMAKYEGRITYEGVREMKYLEMVISETLRIYPPSPTLKRKCVKDFQLPNSNSIIEKGTLIFVPMLGLHLDPDYFPDPFKFAPERFSEENINKIVSHTYLPFGEGPRKCIGERFGNLQVKIGLISLIRSYKFSLNSEVKLPLSYFSGSSERQNIILNVEFIEK